MNPRISLPLELTNVAPAWASCEPLFYGAFDPPSALKKASRLAPQQIGVGPVTVAGPPAATALPAMAQSAPTPDLPQSTAVPNPPQNAPQDANAPTQIAPQNAPPTQATPPTNNAANDPQKAPANPAPPSNPQTAPANPAAASDPQNVPGNVAAAPGANTQKTPGNPVAVAPTDPQQAPSKQAAAPPVDPGQGVSNNPPSNPNNLSPDQLSQLHQALQPSPINFSANPSPPQNNQNNPPIEGNNAVPADSSSPQAVPNNSEQVGNGGFPAAAPNNQPQQQANPNAVKNNNQGPAPANNAQPKGNNPVPLNPTNPQAIPNNSPQGGVGHPPPAAAPDNQAQPQDLNAVKNNNQGPAPANNAQPQAIPYNPQEGGFDPAPIKHVPSAVAAAPATPGNQQGAQNTPNQPNGNTLPNTNQGGPDQPNGNTPPGANLKASQNEPAPLVVGSNGGILVDSGSHKPPAAPGGAVPNALPAATGAAQFQQGNSAAPPTVSVDNSGNIYAVPAPAQPANKNAPPPVSVANNGRIYAAPLNAGAQPVATPAPPMSIGGQAAQVAPDGALHVVGQPVAQGKQATVNGAVVSVGASNVIVDGTTQALPIAANASPMQNALPPSIGGQAIQTAPAGALVIGSQTIAQGSHATVAGSVVSVGSNNVAVDGSSYAIPGAAAFTPLGAPAPLAVAGQAIQTASNGGVVVAGQTIAQGSYATVAGTVVSIGSSNIVLGSSTYALPTNTPPAVGGQAIQAAPSHGVVVAGQTIAQGSKATVAGTVVSVGSSNVVLGGSTFASPANTPPPFAGQAVQAAPSGGLIVAGQTVSQGSIATVSGTVISAGSSNVVVGGSTYDLPGNSGPFPTPAPLSIGGQAIQTAPSGGLVVAGQTISQGGQTILSGTVFSVGTSNIVIGSSTLALPTDTASIPTQAPLLIAGNPVQIASNGGLLVGGQTISQDTQTTLSGVVISIGTSALIIDGTTHAFNPTSTAIPTANSNSEVILTQGEVITQGSSIITYFGPAVSAFLEGSDIVVGTATVSLGASMRGAAVSQGALGGLILSALDNGPSGSAAVNGTSGPGSGSQPTGNGNAAKPSPVVGAGSRAMGRCWASSRLAGLAFLMAMGSLGLVII